MHLLAKQFEIIAPELESNLIVGKTSHCLTVVEGKIVEHGYLITKSHANSLQNDLRPPPSLPDCKRRPGLLALTVNLGNKYRSQSHKLNVTKIPDIMLGLC